MNLRPDSLPAAALDLDLNDPYNAPVMEVWLSALLGECIVGSDPPWNAPIIYDVFEGFPSDVGGLKTRILRPTRANDEAWGRWVAAVETHFLDHFDCEASREVLAEALAAELAGRRSQGRSDRARRSVVAAVPFCPGSAVLQNQVGVTGSTRYNKYHTILEQVYALGSSADEDLQFGAGSKLLAATLFRVRNDERLRQLNLAIVEGILKANDPSISYDDSSGATRGHVPVPMPMPVPLSAVTKTMGPSTPFRWFHESWNALTSEKWLTVLPPRRWVDWMIAVTRLGVGMGLLWRNRWYEEIARMAVSDVLDAQSNEALLQQLSDRMSEVELIRWPESSETSTNRNVKAQFDQSFERGLGAKAVLTGKDEKNKQRQESLQETFVRWRTDQEFQERLQRALSGESRLNRSFKNLRYTAMDLLASKSSSSRADDVESADHYSLLRRSGYGSGEGLYFDPTTEIVAVVASLACGSPNRSATLGDVANQLAKLGLRPSIAELRRLLERAGLSRAVADASLQIEVTPAFAN